MTAITGTAIGPDGAILASASVRFTRSPKTVDSQGGAVVMPRLFTATTNGAGLVSFDLVYGNYLGTDVATGANFDFAVPNAASADWANCISATVIPTPTSYPAGQVAMTGGGSAQDYAGFATRAAFVAWAAGKTPAVGAVVEADGLSYRYIGTGTAISDLAGWVPINADARHWGGVAGSGVDNTTALIAWAAWLSTLAEGVEGFLPGGIWRHTAPIVFSGVRGRVIRGVGGNVIGGGSRLEYIGTAGDAVNGTFQVISNLNYEFRDICFVLRTASISYHINVNAAITPALSSHFIRFYQCSMITAGSGSITTAGILLASAKFVVLDGCNINYNGHYGIICGADDDTTLIAGQLSGASIRNSMIFNDIGLYRAVNVIIEGNTFETKAIDGGTGCIVPLGELKSTAIAIRNNSFIDDGGKTETRAAITTSAYAGTANLAAGSGWEVTGNTFRDRLTSVDVRGGVRIASNMFMQRSTPAASVGVRINSAVPAAALVVIDANDFTMADINSMIAVEDNRVSLADSVIIDRAASADLTLPAVGSYQTVLTGSTIRPLRGGSYQIAYTIVVLVNSAGAGNYRAQLLIGGVEYDTVVRTTGGNSEYITLRCSRIIKLAGTINPVVCTLRIEQATGTASLVRALTNGSTFFQIEELP